MCLPLLISLATHLFPFAILMLSVNTLVLLRLKALLEGLFHLPV